MAKTKIKVGPLPEQSQDYGHYEEEQILWGRVIAFVLVVAVAIGAVANLLMSEADEEIAIPTVPMMPQVKSMTEHREPARVNAETLTAAKDKASVSGAAQDEVSSAPALEESINTESSNVALLDEKVLGDEIPKAQPIAKVISPISTYHEGMAVAALTQELKDGLPVNSLGYDIPMNDEGIIKVILYTQMQGLKGTVLFHDWYRADKRMARVKIPVNVATQRSFSSKFINQQMLGDWTVKIVDGKGELYAEANFSVQ